MSYVREDNTDFDGVVDRLRSNLSGRFHARTGRGLEVFIDRESIGWGEDWRQRIRESVQAATIFIPVVTMRYFLSDACREELMTYHSNANSLGVTQLILPVILTGASQISNDDSREEVRLIEALNYKNIEEAWTEGYDSPEWKRAILQMVDGLDAAIASAERALEEREAGEAALIVRAERPATDEVVHEPPAAEHDVLALGEDFVALKDLTESLIESMSSFAEVTGDSFTDIDFGALSPQQARSRLIVASRAVKASAEEFYDRAGDFERKVNQVDADLRGVLEELREINHPEAQAQADQLAETFTDIGTVTQFLGQLDEMAAMLQYGSMMNVSIRRAVEPGISGMRATRSAMAVIEGWKTLRSGEGPAHRGVTGSAGSPTLAP